MSMKNESSRIRNLAHAFRALLCALSLIGVLTSFGVSAQARAESQAAECVRLDGSGQQQWATEWNPHLVPLGERLSSYVASHSDNATGVAYCSGYDGAAIFVKSQTMAVEQFISDVRAEFPQWRVEMHVVGVSLDDLFQAQRSLESEAALAGASVDSGFNIYLGELDVMSDGEAKSSAAIQAAARRARKRGVSFKVMRAIGKNRRFASARADYAPWTMGSELLYQRSDGKYYVCSSGVPVTIGGVKRLLTAGHCNGRSFKNGGALVGSLYTTAYPGNADSLGDWLLLSGSSYAHNVWSGPIGSESTLPISGMRWDTVPIGTGLCTSGRTTGMICRYRVMSTNRSHVFDGVRSGRLLELFHGDRDGNGFQGGDSGGPCFYNNGSGKMIAAGIVTGTIDWLRGRSYYCTDMTGVRQWAPGATFG